MHYKNVLLMASAAALLLVAGCVRNSPIASSPIVQAAVTQAEFVGSNACADCHRAEFTLHSCSRHARTLHLASRESLGTLAPPEGALASTGFVIKQQAHQYQISQPGLYTGVANLDYALGSGKTGMTYVSLVDDAKLAEFRFSYFPRSKGWHVTPGQEKMGSEDLGQIHNEADARKCLSCHTVTLAANSLKPDPRFFGVGCESCHGAGSLHIAAMRGGRQSAPTMENLSHLASKKLNALCAQCHGRPEEVGGSFMTNGATNRFQVWGLEKSRCFKESNEAISCITCHNPHTDASVTMKTYETVCLKCHSSAVSTQHLASFDPAKIPTKIKVCPVNAKTGCIDCHMPTRKVMPGSSIPTTMADHFIRVYR